MDIRSRDFNVFTDSGNTHYFSIRENGPVNVQNTRLELNGQSITGAGEFELPGQTPADADNNRIWVDESNQELKVRIQGTTFTAATASPNGGVSRYTFDDSDTVSGDAIDIWNGKNAKINGATTGVSGANQTYTTNEAYSFNGADDNVQTPVSDNFTTFSFAVWVNADDTNDGEIVSTRNSSSGSALRLRNGTYDFYALDSNTNSFVSISGSSISTGTWVHLVGVVDTDEIRIYENGSLQNSASFGNYANGANLRIGEPADGSSGSNISADIDDIRIYNNALTDSEASYLYNGGSIRS